MSPERWQQIEQIYHAALERAPEDRFAFLSLIYVGLGERDAAFAWLEKAYQARSEDLLNIRRAPRLDSLRGDPRFTDLKRRLFETP